MRKFVSRESLNYNTSASAELIMVFTENSLRLTLSGQRARPIFFYSRPYFLLCKGNEKIKKIRFLSLLKSYTKRYIYPTSSIMSIFLL